MSVSLTMTIIIKRYANRKLYNTRSKRYITLEQIEALIKDQEEIRIIDNATGEDITAATLSQIIFELEKNRAGFLPQSLLLSLVQSGGSRIEEIRNNIFNSLHLDHHYDVEIERRINRLVDTGELTEEAGSQLLGKMLSVGSQEEVGFNIEGRMVEFLKQRQIPSKSDVQKLIMKIDALSRQVEELQGDEEDQKDSINKNQIIE